jgi:hypothetical protein
MNKFVVTAYLGIFALGCGVLVAEARPEYARATNKQCGYCHARPAGGGARNFRGMFYGANNLSFSKFDEKREAAIAGVNPDSDGTNSMPAVRYVASVIGTATQQVQLASLRGPVIVLFVDSSGDVAKKPIEQIADLAKAYGNRVSVVAVARTDTDSALKLTAALSSRLRILPDEDGAAIKKFGATSGLDMAVVAKQGELLKTFQGFSKANVEAAIRLLAESQDIVAPDYDASKLPDTLIRGAKLAG